MKSIAYFLILILSLAVSGCQKSFLDKKPDQALLVPTTLSDMQALLDNNDGTGLNAAPGLANIAADDFFRLESSVSALTVTERNAYTWQETIYQNASVPDWNMPYQGIFYANVVLDGLSTIERTSSNGQEWDKIKGSALLYRGSAFLHLAQFFAAPYEPATAGAKPGIPLHMTSDVNIIAERGTLMETYRQIISDLEQAVPLLPAKPLFPARASQAAAYAYLSRVFLAMKDYTKAGEYAGKYLDISSTLLDYNSINASLSRPFPIGNTGANPEVIYFVQLTGYTYNNATTTFVDPELYRSYADNDLRKTCFFGAGTNGNFYFKGTYSGIISIYGGPATDEVFLIRSECRIRSGNVSGGMNDLNDLLVKRYRKGSFAPLVAGNQDSALKLVLNERRKELVGRGIRWQDLRRLNLEPDFQKTISRVVSNVTYTLSPNANRYTFPIPDNEITASGIAQNPR